MGTHNHKKVEKLPLNAIKVFNNEAQAKIGKDATGSPRLEVYFVSEQQYFEFQASGKLKIQKWIKEINRAVLGSDQYVETSSGIHAIPGAELVAETIKDTFDTFKTVFNKKTQAALEETKVTKFCTSCGAQVEGYHDRYIKCPYCGNSQLL